MELQEITALFRKGNPIKITMKDTSHNENFPDSKLMKGGYYEFYEDAVLMDSKVASIHFHFSETPSGRHQQYKPSS